MLWQLTKLSAIPAAFFSMTRDDVTLKKAAEMAESFVSCQSIFYPVIMVKNICMYFQIRLHGKTRFVYEYLSICDNPTQIITLCMLIGIIFCFILFLRECLLWN